ncbi:hypothetical protein [Sphingobacterium sp.]|uniref:hypothetical protein n=1 Tax=Sphingobacterium sp. TaxID=341027 RepID=UPI00258A5446|nr:hypothetical protein [Sphingobacterium sp.]WET67885.1 MAG: hypothetical protein P0Y57_18765 [Sphingobacterium sp.]
MSTKIKNLVPYVVSIFCICALVYTLFRISKLKETFNNYQTDIGAKYIDLEETLANYKLSTSLIGIVLNPDLKDIKNQRVIRNEKDALHTFYLYFTESGCNSCVLQELENLSKLKDIHVIVLARYADPIKLEYLLKEFKFEDLTCYCLPPNSDVFQGADPAYLSQTIVFNLGINYSILNALVASSKNPTLSTIYYKRLTI